MSEPRKIRHLLTLLEDYHTWQDWLGSSKKKNTALPSKDDAAFTNTRTFKTDPNTKKEFTKYDDNSRYQKTNPEFSKNKKLDTNIDGWIVPGTYDKAKTDSKDFQSRLGQLAKDYGVDSPRAFTANQSPSIGNVAGFTNPEVSGEHSAMYHAGLNHHPYASRIKLKRNSMHGDEDIAHELAHHNSMNFANVDLEGNMKIIDKHDTSKMGITGFGVSTGDEEGALSPADQFVNMHNQYKDVNGRTDRGAMRAKLYDKVMNNPNNKQRSELKHGLATAVSHILSDPKILIRAKWGWKKQYGFAPEEMWARGIAEFSRMKRLPADERFGSDDDKITPETYNKIQKMMDTIKVRHGHTLAKNRGQQGPNTA
jgi:outer membrane protein OmpA-like peptidoglycan-associated protein